MTTDRKPHRPVIAVRVDLATRDRLRRLARTSGRSQSDVLRDVLTASLGTDEREAAPA